MGYLGNVNISISATVAFISIADTLVMFPGLYDAMKIASIAPVLYQSIAAEILDR